MGLELGLGGQGTIYSGLVPRGWVNGLLGQQNMMGQEIAALLTRPC